MFRKFLRIPNFKNILAGILSPVIACEWRSSGTRGQLNKSAKSLIRAPSIAQRCQARSGERGNKLWINCRERGSLVIRLPKWRTRLSALHRGGLREEARRASEAFAFLPDFITRRVSCLIESPMPYYGRGWPRRLRSPSTRPRLLVSLGEREIAEIMGPEQRQRQRAANKLLGSFILSDDIPGKN